MIPAWYGGESPRARCDRIATNEGKGLGRSYVVAAIAGVLVPLALAGCGAHAAVQCPVPQLQAPGEIGETADQIRAARTMLGDGDENAILTTAAAVRRRHPHAGVDAVGNYLTAAYCPTIAARPGLDRQAGRQAVAAFAERVRSVLATARVTGDPSRPI